MFTGKQTSIFDQPVIAGQDIAAHQNLRSAIFPEALREHGEGRFLQPGDEGQPNIVISRKIAREHPDAAGPAPQGGRHPEDQRQAVPRSSASTRPARCCWTSSSSWTSPRPARSSTAPRARSRASTSRGTTRAERRPGRRDREGQPGLRRPQHGRGPGQLQLADGPDRHVPADDRQPGAAGRRRGDRQHDADEHDRAVRRVRRAADQRLVAGQYPGPGDARECLPGPARRPGRLRAGVDGAAVANQFISGGIHLGMPPSLWALGIGLSVATGTLGGLYPAWRAARLVPMEAIRLGSH